MLRFSLLVLVLYATPAIAQPTWLADRYDGAGVPDLDAVHVISADDFWVAGRRGAESFLVQYRDGEFGEEIPTTNQLIGFYEEGDALYAIQTPPSALLFDDANWVSADLFDLPAGATASGVAVRDEGLWADTFTGGQRAFLREGGGWSDPCLNRVPTYFGAGFAVDGLGRFYEDTGAPCDTPAFLPGPNWMNQSTDASDTVASSIVRIRMVRGELYAPVGQEVFTRALSATEWSSFPVTELGETIQWVAGPDGRILLASRSNQVLDHGEVMDISDPFMIRGVHWSDDGSVVIVGERGGFARRVIDDVIEPPPEVDIGVSVVSMNPAALEMPTAANGAFRIDADNRGVELTRLTVELSTDPPVDIGFVDQQDNDLNPLCRETGVGAAECVLETLASEVVVSAASQASFELPFVLRDDQEYFASVMLTATLTAEAPEGSDSASANAAFVLTEDLETDLALVAYCNERACFGTVENRGEFPVPQVRFLIRNLTFDLDQSACDESAGDVCTKIDLPAGDSFNIAFRFVNDDEPISITVTSDLRDVDLSNNAFETNLMLGNPGCSAGYPSGASWMWLILVGWVVHRSRKRAQ